MGLPWKNAKANPLSRIVSDLQPPSLVLQTGFPTSVVDLFVRNRHRIRRRSFNTTSHERCPLHAPPPSPSLTPHTSPAAPHSLHALQQDSMPAHVEFNVGSGRSNANANANAAHSIYTSSLFVAAAKMFVVVILVLSTKRLVLGITLSAFLLFLLYFFGNFAAPFFDPSPIRNRFFRRRDGLIVHGGEEEDPSMNSVSNNEIQIVESNSEREKSGLQDERFRNWEKGLGCCLDLQVEEENEEEKGQFQVGKNQRSRSAKLRTKIINKLIPKKLRSGKRLKSNKSGKNKTKQETGNVIMRNEQGTEWSCEKEDEEVWQVWKPEEQEEEEEERNKSLDCEFVILMILLGLCGGRFLALVLTVSGCFMLKLIKILNQQRKFG
ncbi:uncharacterized protein LOC111477615 [Cucurbita maxima]|uniref:Uncharacterized protein LOC111477615 n=1 Tax=Cucurbita maxima TaxID=3661 RepID=A0A6J1IJD0_CUCMA|nr:uncharacterized protein LOC111477615 [Cucurbita maxima]